jgi:flagellar biosynthesis component FlhA
VVLVVMAVVMAVVSLRGRLPSFVLSRLFSGITNRKMNQRKEKEEEKEKDKEREKEERGRGGLWAGRLSSSCRC